MALIELFGTTKELLIGKCWRSDEEIQLDDVAVVAAETAADDVVAKVPQ